MRAGLITSRSSSSRSDAHAATFATLVVTTSFLTTAPAAIVVQTGFETTDDPAYNTGTLSNNSALPVFRVGGNSGVIHVVSSPDVFGVGNQYLRLGDPNLNVRARGTTPLTTVSFSGDGANRLFVDNFTRRDDLFVVPEPTPAMLAGLGLFALLLRRRR